MKGGENEKDNRVASHRNAEGTHSAGGSPLPLRNRRGRNRARGTPRSTSEERGRTRKTRVGWRGVVEFSQPQHQAPRKALSGQGQGLANPCLSLARVAGLTRSLWLELCP